MSKYLDLSIHEIHELLVNKKIKPRKEKTRNIMFSSHTDRYIYQLNNNKLNKKYNQYAKSIRINRCSVAYRNNFKKSKWFCKGN